MWTIEHYDDGESSIPMWITTIENVSVVWDGKFNFEFYYGETDESCITMDDVGVTSAVDAYVSAKEFIVNILIEEAA